MIKAIREAGRVPVQRDTFYQPIRVRDDALPSVADADPQALKVLEQNLASA